MKYSFRQSYSNLSTRGEVRLKWLSLSDLYYHKCLCNTLAERIRLLEQTGFIKRGPSFLWNQTLYGSRTRRPLVNGFVFCTSTQNYSDVNFRGKFCEYFHAQLELTLPSPSCRWVY